MFNQAVFNEDGGGGEVRSSHQLHWGSHRKVHEVGMYSQQNFLMFSSNICHPTSSNFQPYQQKNPNIRSAGIIYFQTQFEQTLKEQLFSENTSLPSGKRLHNYGKIHHF